MKHEQKKNASNLKITLEKNPFQNRLKHEQIRKRTIFITTTSAIEEREMVQYKQ
jgi:hypothetical protein